MRVITDISDIERRIADLRRQAFVGTAADQEAITRQIVALKTLAKPDWDAKQAIRESAYARVMWM